MYALSECSSVVETYEYDYLGNRTAKNSNGVTTEYVTDLSSGYSQVLKAETDTDTVYYTRGFELISRKEGTTVSYYIYDGSLSVRALTNEAGAVTDTLIFDAFGNATTKTGSSDNPYGFQGEEQDETGLYYLRARYMDPATGSFTTMDTYGGSLSDPMSLHKYLFANSNPVMYCDPSGHYTLSQQETAIAIQAIIGEAMSGIFYIADWLLTDPESQNHSIPMMIVTMMIGLAQGAVMGSWGGLLSGLITKAGLSVLDYILTGIMFALFAGDLKLAAINLRESDNWLVAVLCDAGGDFAGVVAFASFSNGIAKGWNALKEKVTNTWSKNRLDKLDWSNVDGKGRSALEHIQKHSYPNYQRETHGVFRGDAKTIIEDAWTYRENAIIVSDNMGGTIYNIPYPNAGYNTGYKNFGQEMNYVTIIVQDGTSKVWTAFPSFGNYGMDLSF